MLHAVCFRDAFVADHLKPSHKSAVVESALAHLFNFDDSQVNKHNIYINQRLQSRCFENFSIAYQIFTKNIYDIAVIFPFTIMVLCYAV